MRKLIYVINIIIFNKYKTQFIYGHSSQLQSLIKNEVPNSEFFQQNGYN